MPSFSPSKKNSHIFLSPTPGRWEIISILMIYLITNVWLVEPNLILPKLGVGQNGVYFSSCGVTSILYNCKNASLFSNSNSFAIEANVPFALLYNYSTYLLNFCKFCTKHFGPFVLHSPQSTPVIFMIFTPFTQSIHLSEWAGSC